MTPTLSPHLLKEKEWRLKNLYKIINKQSDLVIFKPNLAQQHFLKNRSQRNIILKSRQLGFTTLATIDMLDNILFNPNFSALLISYDDESARDLFQKKVMFAWGHLNSDLKKLFQIDSSRSNMLRLDLGENNFSSFKVDNTGRSGTYNQLHVSELALISKNFPEKVDKIIRGTFPCVHPPKGQITIESTSEGPYGAFYEMFMQAFIKPGHHVYRPTEFKAFFYNWQWDIEALNNVVIMKNFPKEFLDIQRKHNELAAKDPNTYRPVTDLQLSYYFQLYEDDCKSSFKKLFLEYPLTPDQAFQKNSTAVFDADKLNKLLLATYTPKEFKSWLFYDEIKPNHEYVLGADPSEGIGRDHSAAVLLDITPLKPKVVATFMDNEIQPDIFAFELKTIAEMANMAFIIPERNNSGHATITKLKDIYPTDKIYRQEKQITEETTQTTMLGWHTTQGNKPKMFYDLSTAINEESIDIPSEQIVKEAMLVDREFVSTVKIKDDDNITSNHLDLLTALALAYQGRLQAMEEGQEAQIFVSKTRIDPFSLI